MVMRSGERDHWSYQMHHKSGVTAYMHLPRIERNNKCEVNVLMDNVLDNQVDKILKRLSFKQLVVLALSQVYIFVLISQPCHFNKSKT